MTSKVAVYGAGGHARSLVPLLVDLQYEVLGVYDDTFTEQELICDDIYLRGALNHCPEQVSLILAVGNNSLRMKLFHDLFSRIEVANIIHPSVVVRGSRLGQSNQIFPFAYIGSQCTIGSNNIINTGSVIEHESSIGNNCHISINSTISGRVMIGNDCFIGAGSTVIDNVSVCDRVTVGAGAVVVKDITEAGTYVGIPAKKV